ncbi:hypothetical protein PanWU01x14_150260 [Parasponia andersonii]|uniref:Uncharacterized protein n=1 Tax=Parasponia andersonii TaxID=3476 RepID=A0A2P5CIM0_PARAD|nr:hypothetical protein PanWU01x14_150260 [Parasponia andersonii]
MRVSVEFRRYAIAILCYPCANLLERVAFDEANATSPVLFHHETLQQELTEDHASAKTPTLTFSLSLKPSAAPHCLSLSHTLTVSYSLSLTVESPTADRLHSRPVSRSHSHCLIVSHTHCRVAECRVPTEAPEDVNEGATYDVLKWWNNNECKLLVLAPLLVMYLRF